MGIKLDFLKKTLKENSEVKQDSIQGNLSDKKDYFLEKEMETLKKKWDILKYIENSGFNIDFESRDISLLPSIEDLSISNINVQEKGETYKKISDVNLLKSILFKK
ncbi:hypothetical protein [Sulfurihydrogenibium azorense]|uniref:hypothetical protein n=1 Tax=Sulfurihydrogenibium azorense TaxID=309806 RepID=UPI00240923AE|nr:hypothetical protein [Sulfurihydrogenibium azorense]MDM7273789.1 hypothetical protein [Sulfurihydrogenibium azorense]